MGPGALEGPSGTDKRNQAFTLAVLKPWLDTSTDSVLAPMYESASWGSSFQAGRDKAGYFGAVYQADVPLRQTWFAQIFADSTFTSTYTTEHEIIVGDYSENSVLMKKADMVIYYRGEEYKYARRQELWDEIKNHEPKLWGKLKQ
jgi:hypothetical protein